MRKGDEGDEKRERERDDGRMDERKERERKRGRKEEREAKKMR